MIDPERVPEDVRKILEDFELQILTKMDNTTRIPILRYYVGDETGEMSALFRSLDTLFIWVRRNKNNLIDL
jgi:3-deoxy-D-manno-octulosonic-acid transferase